MLGDLIKEFEKLITYVDEDGSLLYQSINSKLLEINKKYIDKQKIIREIESIKNMIPDTMLDENDSYLLLTKVKKKLNLLLYAISFMEEQSC